MNMVTLIPLVGNSHCLSQTDVTNFESVISKLQSVQQVDISFQYNDVSYTGVMTASDDDLKLLIVIDNECVALPKGQCIEIACDSTDADTCDLIAGTLSDSTLLGIVGDDGCVSQTISYAQLKSELLSELQNSGSGDPTSMPDSFSFCDLFPDGQIPSGSLVAGDMILTVDGQGDTPCAFKAVPITDITCEE